MVRIHTPPRQPDSIESASDVTYTLELRSGTWSRTAEINQPLNKRVDYSVIEKAIDKMFKSGVDDVARALAVSFRDGIRKATREYLPLIAVKSGLMRSSFVMVMNEVANSSYREWMSLVGSRQLSHRFELFNIERFTSRLIAAVTYAQYHIEGRPHHPGSSFYERPTVDGTAPIDLDFFVDMIFRNIIQETPRKLRSQFGFEVTQ